MPQKCAYTRPCSSQGNITMGLHSQNVNILQGLWWTKQLCSNNFENGGLCAQVCCFWLWRWCKSISYPSQGTELSTGMVDTHLKQYDSFSSKLLVFFALFTLDSFSNLGQHWAGFALRLTLKIGAVPIFIGITTPTVTTTKNLTMLWDFILFWQEASVLPALLVSWANI